MNRWNEIKRFVKKEWVGVQKDISNRKFKPEWEQDFDRGCEMEFSHISWEIRKLDHRFDGKIVAQGTEDGIEILDKWTELKKILENEIRDITSNTKFRHEWEQDFDDGREVACSTILKRMLNMEREKEVQNAN